MCAQNVSYLEKRWKVFFEMISYFTITYKVLSVQDAQFSKFYEKVEVISWFFFHFIWEKYVLSRYHFIWRNYILYFHFDWKKLNRWFFSHFAYKKQWDKLCNFPNYPFLGIYSSSTTYILFIKRLKCRTYLATYFKTQN